MKKLFLAFSVAAILCLSVIPSQALVGSPDDVPGTHLIQPFFIVAIDPQDNENTLMTLTEVKGLAGVIHWTIYDKHSIPRANDNVPYSPFDVIVLDGLTLLQNVSAQGLAALECDLDGDTIPDHYMGYIEYINSNGMLCSAQQGQMFFNWALPLQGVAIQCDPCNPGFPPLDANALNGWWAPIFCPTNPNWWPLNAANVPILPLNAACVAPGVGNGADNFIGHMYVVDIPTGRASGATFPAREWAPRSIVQPAFGVPALLNPLDLNQYWPMQNAKIVIDWVAPITYLPVPIFTDYEVFTAAALAYSKFREHSAYFPWFGTPWVPPYFALLPRFYLVDDTGETYLFIWSSANMGQFEQGGPFNPDIYYRHIDIWDEDEHSTSETINIPWELNFINVREILPSNWLGGAIGGWINLRWDINWLDTWDPAIDFPWITSMVPMVAEWLAYSLQWARSPNAQLNWNALFTVHRDAGKLVPLLPIGPPLYPPAP